MAQKDIIWLLAKEMFFHSYFNIPFDLQVIMNWRRFARNLFIDNLKVFTITMITSNFYFNIVKI